jgi:hypothetical protein
MSDNRVTIFADGILDASVTYGVARMTLAQTGAEGKPTPCGQLVVPLVQLPSLVTSLTGLLKQVEARMKEQQPASTPEGAAPAAFRFG